MTGTLSLPGILVGFADDAKYTFPLNFGFRKSGAFRFRWDRRGSVVVSSRGSIGSFEIVLSPMGTGSLTGRVVGIDMDLTVGAMWSWVPCG